MWPSRWSGLRKFDPEHREGRKTNEDMPRSGRLPRRGSYCYTRPVPGPPTLFHNGRILTGEQLLSPAPRIVPALLVIDGLVAAAGSVEDLERAAPSATLLIDLDGAFAMPGFNDAHLHLGEGARQRREVNLAGARTMAEALARIESAAASAQPGAWLTGGGWDETLWPEIELPSRHDLDRVTGDHPAVFARIDVHLAVANSRALRLGGITRDTLAPAGSAIDHDAAGEPTGILRERGARDLVERHIPPATLEERKRGLRLVLAEALSLGITSVQDNSTDEDFAALRSLHAAGELPLRVSEWLPFDSPLDELIERRAALPQAAAPQDRFLHTGMLKAFLDGSLGSRTAALLAPYADAPDTTGIPLYRQEHLNQLALERAAVGFQLGFHAIGDRAVQMALEAFAAVDAASREAGRPAGNRFRIEHAQIATQNVATRAHAVGAIASMQPCHLLTDMRWARQRLGPERATGLHAWRSFLSAGVPLAFGTDFPVEPLNPFRGLYAAVTRQGDPPLSEPFFPDQRLSMPEALFACTQGAAFAENAEAWKGVLQPGSVADFVVLDRDLLALGPDLARASDSDPRAILDTRVLRTVVGGQTVYQAPAG